MGHGRRWRGGRGGAPGPAPLASPRACRPRAPAWLGCPRGGCAEPSTAGAALVQTRGTRRPGAPGCGRNHGGCLSSPPLLSASLFTIWRPAFKLYFYSQRHFGCIYDLQTSPGERWGLPRGPFCGSSSGAGAGILPL